MGKILDLYNARYQEGQLYRKIPIKPDNSDNVHPILYVYPDANVSVKDDVVLAKGSMSHFRDIDRMNIFGQSLYGRKFLQSQKDLQRKNPWAQTRRYREDNVKDHTEDPNLHQQRHGRSLSSLKRDYASILGEFAVEGNDGKLQTETSYTLTKDPGPVQYRMQSPEGMLNTGGLTVVDLAAGTSRSYLTGLANSLPWLVAGNRYLSDARGTYRDTTVEDRPEIQYGYLEKIHGKNRGLKDEHGFTHGHIYLSLPENDEVKTYYDTHAPTLPDSEGMGKNLGLMGYEQLRPGSQINSITARFLDDKFSQVEDVVGNVLAAGAQSVLGVFGIQAGREEIKRFGGRFLPRFSDIEFFNTLRTIAVDVDKFIFNRNGLLSMVFGSDANQNKLIPVSLKDRYEGNRDVPIKFSQNFLETEREIYQGIRDPKLQRYIKEVSNYKSSNAGVPLGFGRAGTNTEGVDGDDTTRIFKGTKYDEKRSWTGSPQYYKDYTQTTGYIYKRQQEDDVDSIDVIFRVLGKTDVDDVRFRAFIENINETVTPMYNETKYIGRYETHYTYDRVTRDLSFNLRLQAFSKEERNHIMSKMAYLTSLAYPESTSKSGAMGYLSPLITLITIGRVYRQQPCLVQSLTHTIEEDTSWDINNQTPMSILVNLGVRLLDKKHYTHDRMKNSVRPFQLYLSDHFDTDKMTLLGGQISFADAIVDSEVRTQITDPNALLKNRLMQSPITATPIPIFGARAKARRREARRQRGG